MTPLVPNKFSNFNFMQFPDVWSREEYNNQVASCPINGRDVNFCQMMQVGDPVRFGFRPAYGDNLYNYLLASGSSTSGGTNQLIDSGAAFNTIDSNYFGTTEGALIYKISTQETTKGINPVTATTITTVDDLFTGAGETYEIAAFKSVTGAWKLLGASTLTRNSDTTTASNGQILGLMTPGKYYRLKFTVSNWQRGAVLVVFGTGGTERLIEGNGTFEVYGFCGGIDGTLYFLSSIDSNWIGQINLNQLELNEIVEAYTVGFWTDVNNPPVWTDSGGIQICTDGTATYQSDRASEEIFDAVGTSTCGYFGIVSGECAGSELTCGDLDITVSNPTYVTPDYDLCTFDFKDARDGDNIVATNPCIASGEEITVTFTVTNFTSGRLQLIYNDLPVGSSISANGTYSRTFTSESTAPDFRIESVFEGTNATVSDIIVTIGLNQPEFMSECFNIAESFQCGQRLQFDTRSNYGRCENLVESIRLCSRVRNSQIKDQSYSWLKNTTGGAGMISANLLDIREWVVSPIPPYLIRAVQLALRSPYISIDDTGSNYISVGEITPDYNDNTELGRIIATIAPADQSDTYGIV